MTLLLPVLFCSNYICGFTNNSPLLKGLKPFVLFDASTSATIKSPRFPTCFHHPSTTTTIKASNNDYDDQNINNDPPPLVAFLEKASNTGLDNKAIKVNSLVVSKYDLPESGIFADQTYELESIYLQGKTSDENGSIIEKIPLKTLDLENKSTARSGYTLYITLFNPMYHERPVIVTPEEVGLVSMKDEVLDSVLVAIPILSFW